MITTIEKTEVKPLVTHLVKADNHLWLALTNMSRQLDTLTDATNKINKVTGITPPQPGEPPTNGGGPITPPGGTTAVITIVDAKVTQKFNDLFEVDVDYTVTGATAQNYVGAAVYIEDPDISNLPAARLGGARLGSVNASGATVPTFDNDSFSSPAVTFVPASTTDRKIRIYLVAYGPTGNPTLVRANSRGSTPSPSISVDIPAVQSTFTLGMEVAWLVTNVGVTVNPKFNLIPPKYNLTFHYTPPTAEEENHRPQGIGNFGGVDIWYKYADGSFANTGIHKYIQSDAVGNPPVISWTSSDYDAQNGTFRVYFVSANDQFQENTIADNTPYVDVTIDLSQTQAPNVSNFKIGNITYQWQIDGSFDALLPFIWDLPTNNVDLYAGIQFWLVYSDGSTKYPQMVPDSAEVDGMQGSKTVYMNQIPSSCENWTVAAITVDFNNKLTVDPNSYDHTNPTAFGAPVVTFQICPPSPNTQYANAVMLTSPVITPVATPDVSSDGVSIVSFSLGDSTHPAWYNPGQGGNPKDNRFTNAYVVMVVDGEFQNPYGQWKVPAGQNWFTTPYVAAPGSADVSSNIDFFILSENAQGMINSLTPAGIQAAPDIPMKFTPQPGKIKASLLPTGWFNTDEFSWPVDPSGTPVANGFTANIINAGKIGVGSVLRVGGAPASSGLGPSFAGQNGQIAVYSSGVDPGDVNNQPVLRAWMGQQTHTGTPDNPTANTTINGGWFSALYVGGNDPTTAALFVNNGGIVQVGGWDVQTLLGTTYYPYISVRDNTGVEKGRIGADLHYNWQPSPNFVLHGAWFSEFAAGGASMGQYKVLIDHTGNFYINDIDNMTFDYPERATTSFPYPWNYHYQARFGRNIWDAGFLPNNPGYPYFQFPGLAITQVESTPPGAFGTTLLSRGLVMRGSTSVSNAVLGSLVMWNGDQQGTDNPNTFWTELAMYAPTDPSERTVYLASGYVITPQVVGQYPPIVSTNPIFSMSDHVGDYLFQVDLNADTLIFRRNKMPLSGGGVGIKNLFTVDGQGNVSCGNGATGIFRVMDSTGSSYINITVTNGIVTSYAYV